jgi:hypothetical protein
MTVKTHSKITHHASNHVKKPEPKHEPEVKKPEPKKHENKHVSVVMRDTNGKIILVGHNLAGVPVDREELETSALQKLQADAPGRFEFVGILTIDKNGHIVWHEHNPEDAA